MTSPGPRNGDVYVLDWLRTPRGKSSARGSLHHLSPTDLVVALLRELRHRTDVDPADIDDLILGVASQSGEQGADIARTAALLAGWDGVPGATVNRFCASGIDAVSQTAARIRSGDLSLAVAGGVESVSRVPIFSDGGPLWSDPAVVSAVGSVHMGIAADISATVEGWSREELDGYAVETHAKAAQAWSDGFFDRSVLPLPGPGAGAVATDELIRPGTDRESLAALPPAFADLPEQDAIVAAKHPGIGPLRHLHTVGSSPQMADGAAVLLLGDAAAAGRLGLTPRARVIASATAAVDPVIMLTAGQSATEQVISRAGLSPADIDIFEFAEAFSALCLRFRRDLGAGPERMNPHGGTMAMGHAFGATGAILVGQAIDGLERTGGRYAVAAVSGAAGLGVALLLERMNG